MEAYRAESFSVAKIVKESGPMFADAFLSFVSTELIESFNVGKTMNQMQVVFLVNGIKSDYYFLKPEELKYCFDNAKKGRYGTMYDRIDAAVIFGWLEEYLKERTELAYLENEERKKGFKGMELAPGILELMKTVKTKEEPVNTDLVVPERRPRTEHEELIQDILNEFTALHRDKPYEPYEPIRTIPYQNKNVTQDQFLFIRLEELGKI